MFGQIVDEYKDRRDALCSGLNDVGLARYPAEGHDVCLGANPGRVSVYGFA